ncbi:alanine/glycine:cation symporter family protein, partial [Xanthovirga aplysinae]|uniref:alanine/glycine:cation symporter family protein n=1 Tax=Xanthovirga aplysinae TaxID=2529853 RepID=UPI0012BC6DB2
LNDFLLNIDRYLGSSEWFVYLLLGVGLFFTVYLKFPQIRYFRHSLRIVRGKYDKVDDVGDTSHFQALTTALSGTVGTGNIAGVALAVHLGGPSALFWMIVTAFLGMTTKFVEVTLSHKYREKAEDGSIAGGPMYYMKNRLNMRWMAVLFAIAAVISSFGTGNLPQINSISGSLFSTLGVNKVMTGIFLAIPLGFVIIGGIKRIARITERLVPLMAVLYLIGAFGVIIFNYENILPSISAMFTGAFTGTAAAGGFLGASFSFMYKMGVNRGLFSNEAGQGSAPIAHASAKAHEPVSEGMVAILEPFIDTILICSITGLVLLTSGVWKEKLPNEFQITDTEILAKQYVAGDTQDRELLYQHLNGGEDLPTFDGQLEVKNGQIVNPISIIHSHSLAEDVMVYQGGSLFNGTVNVEEGSLDDQGGNIVLRGKSLLHSAPLTTAAFERGFFGEFGKYIVSFGLVLFAFSTAISWSYYGGRAMTYLFGSKSVVYYNIIYVIAFVFGAFVDTTIIWSLAGVSIALMTIPNLVGVLLLRKEMKSTVKDYWDGFRKEYPNEKAHD